MTPPIVPSVTGQTTVTNHHFYSNRVNESLDLDADEPIIFTEYDSLNMQDPFAKFNSGIDKLICHPFSSLKLLI